MSVVQQLIPAGTWTVDPVHSSVGFAVRHLGVSFFRGRFDTVQATLEGGDEAVLAGVVPVESISVGEPNLRGHLLSPEFFDVERHPEITFRSTGIEATDGGAALVHGEFTINGIARDIVARGHISDVATGPAGNELIAVSLETTIDRREFGLDWNAELPGGRLALDNEVTLTVDLELGRQV